MQFLDPFAAQIAAMDLVISVDNSTVHFAGAIGKPCWVLLPVNSDWRWLIERAELDLVRQPGPVPPAAGRGLGARSWPRSRGSCATSAPNRWSTRPAEMCLRCARGTVAARGDGAGRGLFPLAAGDRAPQGGGLPRHRPGRAESAAMSAMRLPCWARPSSWRRIASTTRPIGRWRCSKPAIATPAERLARDLTRQGNDPTALMAMGQILAAKGAARPGHRLFRPRPADRSSACGGPHRSWPDLQAAQGEVELAQRNFTRLIQQVAPDLPGPRAALAEIDLRHGRDAAGWPNFAWRFGTTPEELPRHLAMMAPDDRPKSWTGGKIRRRRLFLRAERNSDGATAVRAAGSPEVLDDVARVRRNAIRRPAAVAGGLSRSRLRGRGHA